MKMNKNMRKLYESALHRCKKLPKELADILDKGFIIKDGCVFLKYYYKKSRHISRDNYIDETGYEAFVNHDHIDNYVNKNYLSVALLFMENIGASWKKLGLSGTLRIIISQQLDDERYGSIRFHLLRENQSLLRDDLEEYKLDGILFEDFKSEEKEDVKGDTHNRR